MVVSTQREIVNIVDAAEEVGVSTATIRNWIKLGYLEGVGRGRLFRDTLVRYQSEVVGRDKLTKRANKRYKSSEVEQMFDLSLWREYECGLAESYRNSEGVYYTPDYIVDDMLRRATEGVDLSGLSFLDPACGSGNFIIKAIELGFDPRNIYGYDTDERAVSITRYRIKELTGYDTENIVCADFLERADILDLRFDYIFTNPPWGKKYLRRVGGVLAKRYETGGSRDSSSLFVMASLALLRPNGVMGFLLQQALFNIRSYAEVRRHLLRRRIDRLVDYGRAFRSLMTAAQAIVLTNRECGDGWMVECGEGRYRSQWSFEQMPNQILNFQLSQSQSEVIVELLRREHITLADGAQWGMGVVTGDNSRFCRQEPLKGDVEVYRGGDIMVDGLRPSTLYMSDDLSIYQQSASRRIYDAPCKLIYKFITSRLCFFCDREQRRVLNSANCLIPQIGDVSPEELTKLLNSDFMSWLFRSIFVTHKVLRRDLETLPIFADYFAMHAQFVEEEYLAYLGVERLADGAYRFVEQV